MLTRPRLSRIYYDGKWFDYPLKAGNALAGLGLWQAFLIGMSYLWRQLFPIKPEVSFEDWTVNRFGWKLYNTFFKAYTEKVWGIPCNQIGAQWAAQRIKGLSLFSAAKEMLLAPFRSKGGTKIRSLIEEFKYPRLGPGMMWERFTERVKEQGGTVTMGAKVVALHHEGGRVTAIDYEKDGRTIQEQVEAVVSSMPLRQLIQALSPAAPQNVRDAATKLSYRDFLTVALIVDQAEMFPDNWIYVHDPGVKLGRIQNFKNWSPEMVPDPSKSCLGLEYFCFEGDGLWTMADKDLIALGTKELALIGLADPKKVIDGTVVRMPKAYPVYDGDYLKALDVLREYLSAFKNLQLAGRNGLHKYNNQDHAMVTGILAAKALLGAKADPWLVNVEDDYHEEGGDDSFDLDIDLGELLGSQPRVPTSI
jgi:protoporphyrinogen oxidase